MKNTTKPGLSSSQIARPRFSITREASGDGDGYRVYRTNIIPVSSSSDCIQLFILRLRVWSFLCFQFLCFNSVSDDPGSNIGIRSCQEEGGTIFVYMCALSNVCAYIYICMHVNKYVYV